MRRICASSPGIELKMTIVIGTRSHCATSMTLRNLVYSEGLFGTRYIENDAEKMRPNIASVRNVRAADGRVYGRTVEMNASRPIKSGRHPTAKRMSGWVGSDQSPSI